MRQFFLFLLFAIGSITSVNSQIFDPVVWSFDIEDTENDGEYILVFTADIEKNWSVYSQFLESKEGPIATEFTWDEGKNYQRIGKVEESGHKIEGFDKVFEMNVAKFKDEGIFKQRVSVSDFENPITGYLTFMTCDDERCLPPKDVDFSFKVSKPIHTKATKNPDSPKKKITKELEEKSTKLQDQDSPSGLTKKEEKNYEKERGKQQIKFKQEDNESNKMFDPVKWSWMAVETDAKGEYDLIFNAEIAKNWTVYSQYLESEDGPIATSFNFDDVGEDFELLGKTIESGKIKTSYDKIFEMKLTKIMEEGIFTQRVKTGEKGATVKGYFEFMTCDKTRCLPPREIEFSFVLGKGGNKTNNIISNTGLVTDGKGPNGEIAINQKIASIDATYKTPLGDCGAEDVARGQNLWWTFVLGFLGGLLALFTPCVFPLIPLTVSFFTPKTGDTSGGALNKAIIYGASIIGIYVSLGLLITAIFGSTALQDLATNWIANVLFFLVFVIFAISFFGYFEITLPSSWSTQTDKLVDKGGILGIFFMAFTLVLVSFSCTGPIIGSALVESAKSTAGPAVVMLGFSSALALPFSLFAAFPSWLNSLPTAGSWMTSLKVVLGFLEVALALKFLSVADLVQDWGILPYEVFLGLWILTFAAMAAYLFGFIRFPHDPPKAKLSPTRIGFGLATVAWTVYLLSGFTVNERTGNYNTPSILSGLLPPAYNNLFLEKQEPLASIKEKYPSFSKCANNLDCFKDYYEGISYAKTNNKPVLLDFTGHGCVNCRKTEDNIWILPSVWNKIDQEFVLISLYTDERKDLKEPMYSIPRQQKIRNVAQKWQDFQIVNFEQNSQPLYVLMSPDQEVLAAPRGYNADANAYFDFLDCGLKTYKLKNNFVGEEQ